MASALPTAALPSFYNKPEEYGLYNPSPDWIDLTWGGRSMRLPGCKDLSQTPCHFDSEDGVPVPGTLIIRDGYGAGLDGLIPQQGSAFNWRASDAIRNMLGIDPITKIAHSTKAGRGISFVPPVIDQNTFDAVKADAELRWASHEIKWAEEEVRTYNESQQLAERAGTIAPAPDSGYHKAMVILSKHRTRVLGTTSQVDKVIEDSEAEEIAGMEALAMEMAGRAAKDKEIDVKQLASDLMKKPEVRKHLQKEYRIRKIGHTDVPDEPKAPTPVKVAAEEKETVPQE